MIRLRMMLAALLAVATAAPALADSGVDTTMELFDAACTATGGELAAVTAVAQDKGWPKASAEEYEMLKPQSEGVAFDAWGIDTRVGRYQIGVANGTSNGLKVKSCSVNAPAGAPMLYAERLSTIAGGTPPGRDQSSDGTRQRVWYTGTPDDGVIYMLITSDTDSVPGALVGMTTVKK